MNLLISFFTMAIGTAAGVLLGLDRSPDCSTEEILLVRDPAFPELSWLVLLFIVMLTSPLKLKSGKHHLDSRLDEGGIRTFLPIMANIAEIVRGAVQSVPTGQWEASESLAFSRRQTLWQIILPQCFKDDSPMDELVCGF